MVVDVECGRERERLHCSLISHIHLHPPGFVGMGRELWGCVVCSVRSGRPLKFDGSGVFGC